MTVKINGDNTVANPAFTGADTDTGLQCGTNELKLVTGGTEAVTVDSTGQVGIGTNSPIWVLDVQKDDTNLARFKTNSTAGDAYFRINADTGGSVVLQLGDNAATYKQSITSDNSDNALYFNTLNTEKMRIDSSGNVGIGTQSPQAKLDIRTSAGTACQLDLNEGTTTNPLRIQQTATEARIQTNASLPLVIAGQGSSGTSSYIGFETRGNERMRVADGGRVLIGKTATSINTAGMEFPPNGTGLFTRSGAAALLCNRTSSDGTVVQILQGGNTEGTISVSGSTVSYNGGHLSRWSQLAGGAERAEILRGSVLSNLDEMCEWGEENNEQLNRMKVSDVEGDVNVSGVFQCWDDDDDIYTNDFYCAMTGDFVIRIAQGTTVARGDLLMSAGDGTAKPQGDDIVRSKTIAKVTSTVVSETYADGSYCVPCVLMAC